MNLYKKIALVVAGLLALFGVEMAAKEYFVRQNRALFEDDTDEDFTVPEVRTVSLAELYRNFAYDSGLLDPEKVISNFSEEDGYTAPSEEGTEKLREDSRGRIQAIGRLAPLLNLQANFAAASYVELYSRENPMTDQEKGKMLIQMAAYSHALLTASYAGSNSLGVLHA